MAGKSLPDSWMLPGYEHVQLLGSGAGGHVWLALHRESGTLVAVKYLVPGLHASTGFREAYRAEAELLAALDSPHVTRLYEYVEGPEGAAIVMEAVEGSSLRELMKREQAAGSPEAALCILKGSLLGLAAAHAAGVVHRDYKPANVLVTPAGISKLVDFGIAARTGEAAPAAGTPLYMAPEQFHGAPASPAADVYAATATFFECVTGERPFPGANAVELMAQHALGAIPEDLVPKPLRPLIRHGMAKDPFERPATALEFVAELEAVASGAYGADWERRGRRALTAALALLPLLLLAGLQGAGQASSAAVATTFLDEGEAPATLQSPQSNQGNRPPKARGQRESEHGHDQPHEARHQVERHDNDEHGHEKHSHEKHGRHEHGHHEHENHHDHHKPHKGERRGGSRRRRTARWVVGAGGTLVIAAGCVMAAAAYGSHDHTGSTAASDTSAGGSQIGALTGATTLVSPTPSPSSSTTASASASTSPSHSPSATKTATPATSATTPSPTAASTSATPSATRSSPSPSPSPTTLAPVISALNITNVSCVSVSVVDATVEVKSNGVAGSVTFTFFYETVTGAPVTVGKPVTMTVAAGSSDQTLTPPNGVDFTSAQAQDSYPKWGVSVVSSPAAQTSNSPQLLTSTANCTQVIQ